jgi:hypothetical protein
MAFWVDDAREVALSVAAKCHGVTEPDTTRVAIMSLDLTCAAPVSPFRVPLFPYHPVTVN